MMQLASTHTVQRYDVLSGNIFWNNHNASKYNTYFNVILIFIFSLAQNTNNELIDKLSEDML